MTSISDTFKQKLLAILDSLLQLSPEKQAKLFHVIKEMSRVLPEATLVGGIALRLHLKERGMPMPDMKALDIDYVISQLDYDYTRHANRVDGENYAQHHGTFPKERIKALHASFRRKGDHEPVPESMGGGYESFMQSPQNYMALEDTTFKQHVDLFVEDGERDTQVLEVEGNKVSVLTPEELFLRRVQQIRKRLQKNHSGKDKPELPRKIYQYFILNGALVDGSRLKILLEKRKETIFEELIRFAEDLQNKVGKEEVSLVDIYH